MVWHTRNGDKIYALEKGLIFRPENVRVKEYKTEYDG